MILYMKNLISFIKNLQNNQSFPFFIYSSKKEQRLLNVPIVKPLFIAVLGGNKKLGKDDEIICHAGDFIFLSDSPSINMRNIPKEEDYLALLIEFEYKDFDGLQISTTNKQQYCVGEVSFTLEKCLQQFIEYASWAPKELWYLRRKEIIELLCYMGHSQILSMVSNPKVGHKLHNFISNNPDEDVTMQKLCEQLGMSESTLRRKLKLEGTSIQEIKDQVKLSLGLHLLQTTLESVSVIAQKCGYYSQSRFTDRFKARFGLTPSELRKTKMTD